MFRDREGCVYIVPLISNAVDKSIQREIKVNVSKMKVGVEQQL